MHHEEVLCHLSINLDLKLNNIDIKQVSKFTYLGVTFDCKLSWKDHVDEIVTKAQRRLTVIKRLAGSKWGCARSTLNTTYKMFIKPVLKYCYNSLITSPDHNIKKIDKVQNQAMRLITGAVKTTPIDAMLLLTNNKEFSYEIEEAALKLHEKLIRIPNTLPWPHHPEIQRLKTQEGFLQKVKKSKMKYDIHLVPELLLHSNNPMQSFSVTHQLDLIHNCKKTVTSPPDLLSYALETINT